MVYRLSAPDLEPDQTDYRFAFVLRPQTVCLTYISENGSPWTLLYLEIAGLRVRRDGTVNPASFAHTARFYPGSEHFRRMPQWLREFAHRHRVPADAAPRPLPDGQRT